MTEWRKETKIIRIEYTKYIVRNAISYYVEKIEIKFTMRMKEYERLQA